MSNISAWSTTAANNNSSPPDGFPENQLPSTLNNAARELMAAIRTFYQAAAWIDLGDTPTYASTTTFTVPGDQTAFYTVNRRIRCTDATTLYGYISSSVYVASTTVTVVLDSGSLSASLTAVAVSLIDPANYPIPAHSVSPGRFPLTYHTTHTTASLASGASEAFTITHGLGSDNVTVILGGIGNTSNPQWFCTAGNYNGVYFTSSGGIGLTSSAFGYGSPPSSGDISLVATNEHSSSQTITIDITVIRYD